MSTLINFFETTYYITLLFFIESLTVAIVGFKTRNKPRELKYLPTYALISFIQTLLCFVSIIYNIKKIVSINTFSIYLFIVIEILIFYDLLFQKINFPKFKLTMYFIEFFFISFTIYTAITHSLSTMVPPELSIINSICISLPCLFYFYELFSQPPNFSLTKEPSFWVIIGFLFLAISTMPFYFLQNYLGKNFPNLLDNIYTISSFFYCVMFFMILKAFLCNPKPTK